MNKSNSLEHLFPLHLLMKRKSEFRTVIDVGVNKIRYLEFYSQYFDNVIGVEPNPITYSEMSNWLPSNVRLDGICLSNISNVTTFYGCMLDSGYSTMIRDRYNQLIEDGEFSKDDFIEYHIPTDKIDNIYKNENSVDLIKIDAEYEDINIFLGAIDLVNRNRPIIQIEHIEHHINTDVFFDTIKEINYVEIKPYFESRNYFFIPKEDII
jgi:FkbM family methyltransferase